MSTFYCIGECVVLAQDTEYGVGQFAERIGEAVRPAVAERRKRIGRIAKKIAFSASEATGRKLADYLPLGVTPWVTRMAFDWCARHTDDGTLLEMLGTALLFQEEHPGAAPKRIWSEVQRSLRPSPKVGFSGCSMSTQRAHEAAHAVVDADSALLGVAAAVMGTQEAYILAEESERDARMVSLIVTLLGDLGTALQDGKTMEEAAKSCSIEMRAAYYRVDKVRELLNAA